MKTYLIIGNTGKCYHKFTSETEANIPDHIEEIREWIAEHDNENPPQELYIYEAKRIHTVNLKAPRP